MFKILLLLAVPILAVVSLQTRNSITALLSFAGMMGLLGIYYISIELQLLGLLQIFVYTGGVAVLMLFGLSLIGNTIRVDKVKPLVLSSILFFTAVVGFAILKYLPESGENIQVVEKFPSDLLLIFAMVIVSILYSAVKIVSVKRRSR